MKKILVVDDEADLCELVQGSLQKTGEYVVEAVSDPEKVIDKCKDFKPDLILLDIVMPKLNGTDLIKELRRDRDLARVRIVVTSGLGEMVYSKKKDEWKWQPNRQLIAERGEDIVREKSAERAAAAYGVDDYLAKPFKPELLRQVVKDVLEQGDKDSAGEGEPDIVF
ncbi:MAG TPA: response regulator [Candidatus Omnitrophota bacterium]|nr:response regulator [Candidatus Omnitrophota bacterium]HPN55775.1 response regulator [Candidatus Omnitrophota bacterium]